MDDLVRWLGQQLDEDELWAREASRRSGEQAPSDGVHWQWTDPETDQVVTPDPARDEFVGGEEGFRVSLRSRETWRTASGVGDLPQFAIPTAEEVPSAVGGHIIRHDPARVLLEIDAKRELLRQYEHLKYDVTPDDLTGVWAFEAVLRAQAVVYAERTGYREEWRP